MIGGIICSHGHACLPVARSTIDDRSSIIGRIAAAKRYLCRCVIIGESRMSESRGAIISFHTRSVCEDLIPFN